MAGERDAVLSELELLVSGQHSSKYACVLTTFPSQADNKRSAAKDPPEAWPVSAFKVPLERKRPLASATWVCCRPCPASHWVLGAEHSPRGAGSILLTSSPCGSARAALPPTCRAGHRTQAQPNQVLHLPATVASSGMTHDPSFRGVLLEALRFAGASRVVKQIGCVPEKRANGRKAVRAPLGA